MHSVKRNMLLTVVMWLANRGAWVCNGSLSGALVLGGGVGTESVVERVGCVLDAMVWHGNWL